ncbi:vWA domain-containing protein [Lichenicoccus sp.]|uniref:vWA domain-containing protein n=1 Tax=Lichenicoccus sp. TaxID=2781899 RepID=UPI003D0A5B2A
MSRLLARLRHDRRGNVAILVGLLILPIIGLLGLAIDFGQASMARAKLDLAADSAALLATTAASNAYLAGAADPIGTAQAAAQARFTGQAGAQSGVTIGNVAVTVTQSGPLFASSITYSGAIATTFGRIFGVDTIALNGQSSASLSISPYRDIQVLMDVSSSMTIAATTAAINQMEQLTSTYKPPKPLANVTPGEKCAFACHSTRQPIDYYALAQRNGVLLRLDVLRSAVGNLITNIEGLDTQNTMRLGLYTFAENFNQIFPLSTQISAASGALSQIAPDINDCSANCPETYFANAMDSVASLTGISGNGSSQATSQKFLFVVTDGLIDQYTGGNRVIRVVNASDCSAIKANGVNVLVLYTPYLPLTDNAFYNQFVAPIQSQIEPGLQTCASSPGLVFEADSASDIDTQLQKMLATVIRNSGHLTQ